MDKLKYLYLSWNTLHNTIHKLSNKVKKDYKPDLIVAIARGGLTIAHIMSDFLELPITTFTISSYKDQKQVSVPKIILHLSNKLHNKKILLVDNISDTGKTFIRGIEYLKENGVSEIKSACPYIKPWTKYTPDYYQESVTKWVIFPFDMKENIVSLTRQMRKKGFTDKKIVDMLTEIKIPKSFIDYYLAT